MVRSVETRKHITTDGCFLGDKVTAVLEEGEKLIKSAEAHLYEHYKMGVTSAHKELQPIAGGMADGSRWTSKIIEQDWDGVCETARKTLMKSDAKMRKQRKNALQQVCGAHLLRMFSARTRKNSGPWGILGRSSGLLWGPGSPPEIRFCILVP